MHSRVARVWAALRARREWWLAPIVIAGVTFVLYRTIWFAPHGKPRQWFGWDCIESFWPDLSYYAGAIRHGAWPLWNPYDRGGYAFYGDPHPGIYYPVTWLFVLPGAVAGSMPGWTIQLKALAHHWIGGVMLYAYLRSRRLPWPAALVGGVAFIVSVPMIIHKASALAWPMVWAPLVWIAIDRAVAGADKLGWWRRGAALAGAIGLAGSAGPPPGFFYILIVSLAYGALRVGQVFVDAGRDKRRVRAAAIAQARTLAVAAAGTLALLCVVVLPGLSIATESATRGSARNVEYALNTALPAGRALAGMVAPTGGMVDPYLGLSVLVLAVVALATRPRADRWAPVFFVGVAAFALDLATGKDGHVLKWLVLHVPGFGLFREPNRYKIVTAMAMAVVAGHGVAALALADAAKRRRVVIALGGALAAALVGVIAIRAGSHVKQPKAFPGYALSFEVLAAAAVVLGAVVGVPEKWRAAAVAALVPVMFVDVTRFGVGFLGAREAPVDDQADRKYLADLPGDVSREWRVYDEFVMEQRPGSRLRVRDLRGYPSGDPFDDARYSLVRERLAQNPELLAAFNVRWVLWGPHHRNGLVKNHVKRAPDQSAPARFRKLDAKRWEVIDPAPLVAWYGGVQVVPDLRRAVDAVVAEEQQPGQRVKAIVEQADRPKDLGGTEAAANVAAPVVGRLVSYEANRVAVAVDAPATGVVVLNEKMAAGWHVTVDGKAAQGFRANVMLRAVVVPAGTHTIVWTYSPPHYALLFGAWLAGVGLLVVAAWSARRARRVAATAAAAATAATAAV